MKIKPVQHSSVIKAKTQKVAKNDRVIKWWLEKDSDKRANGIVGTAAYLKETQAYRYRQAAVYAKLYGNQSLFNFIGSNIAKLDAQKGLPQDRPTRNVIQSSVDTLVSRLTQSRPAPVFLTDNSDYRERNLAKKLNNFILGEFYQTKAYDLGEQCLRDGMIEGTGCLKVFETIDHKVGVERKLLTELLIDPSESIYGQPRQLYELKLMDRDVLYAAFPKFKEQIKTAESAYPDNNDDSSRTVADLVMVVEGWHLRSSKNSDDGYHSIACSSGEIFHEKWEKDVFPFVFFHYAPRMLGFWAQGIAERLMGTQLDINSMLYQISRSIKLVGVPRVFQETGSKVASTSHNNDIGVIVKYTGIKPSYEVAPCVPIEMYQQLDRMVEYAFQQEGVSSMQAASQKPSGLNSGEAIRSYDDIATDRFASTARKYNTLYIDLAYQIIDLARCIAERDGKYQTVFPDRKTGAKTIDLPDCSLIQNPFIIQCYEESSLPRDPAGRQAKIAEMVQSGMITIREGRRLMRFPDIDQMDSLANALEERVFQVLDDIIEGRPYTAPEPYWDLAFAEQTVVQYLNLYPQCKIEPEKCDLLRLFKTQVEALQGAAQQAAIPPAPTPTAVPAPPPVSPILPNTPGS